MAARQSSDRTLTEEQQRHAAEFMDACRGASPWNTGRALRVLTPGTDWRHCSKRMMAEAYAIAKAPAITQGVLGRPYLASITPAQLRAKLIEHGWIKP